jgi:cytochrome oxidase assembly protein ShyY1
MRRAHEKETAQAARDAALARPAYPVSQEAQREGALDGVLVWVQGYLLEEQSIFLDNRTRQGVAGFHVLTPMRLLPAAPDDPRGQHVLILRGWIARDVADRTRLPALRTPAGVVRIEGLGMTELAQPLLLGGEAGPGPQGSRIWQRMTLPAYAAWAKLPLQPVLIRQLSELDDGLQRDWVQPGGGADKHRAYALQWFAMAGVTALLWVVLGLRAARQRDPDVP